MGFKCTLDLLPLQMTISLPCQSQPVFEEWGHEVRGRAWRASLFVPQCQCLITHCFSNMQAKQSFMPWLWSPWVRVFCNRKVEPHAWVGVFPPETTRDFYQQKKCRKKKKFPETGKAAPTQNYGTLISQYIKEKFGWFGWNRVDIGDMLYFTVAHCVQSGAAMLSKGKDGWQEHYESFN